MTTYFGKRIANCDHGSRKSIKNVPKMETHIMNMVTAKFDLIF